MCGCTEENIRCAAELLSPLFPRDWDLAALAAHAFGISHGWPGSPRGLPGATATYTEPSDTWVPGVKLKSSSLYNKCSPLSHLPDFHQEFVTESAESRGGVHEAPPLLEEVWAVSDCFEPWSSMV